MERKLKIDRLIANRMKYTIEVKKEAAQDKILVDENPLKATIFSGDDEFFNILDQNKDI